MTNIQATIIAGIVFTIVMPFVANIIVRALFPQKRTPMSFNDIVTNKAFVMGNVAYDLEGWGAHVTLLDADGNELADQFLAHPELDYLMEHDCPDRCWVVERE